MKQQAWMPLLLSLLDGCVLQRRRRRRRRTYGVVWRYRRRQAEPAAAPERSAVQRPVEAGCTEMERPQRTVWPPIKWSSRAAGRFSSRGAAYTAVASQSVAAARIAR